MPPQVLKSILFPDPPAKPEDVPKWLKDRLAPAFLRAFEGHFHTFPGDVQGELRAKEYTEATKPTAADAGRGAMIISTDAGTPPQMSDGTGWINLGGGGAAFAAPTITFGTTYGAGAAGTVIRSDSQLKFPTSLMSTLNSATLTLTDGGSNETLTSSLGGLTLDALYFILDQPTGSSPTRMTVNLDPDFNSTGIKSAWSGGAISGPIDIMCWDAAFTSFSGVWASPTILGFNQSTFALAPSAGSSGTGNYYGIRTRARIDNNNLPWGDVAAGYFVGPRRFVTTPTITTQAGIIVEPPTADDTDQFGILIRQQPAQVPATNRFGIDILTHNSGTNRWSLRAADRVEVQSQAAQATTVLLLRQLATGATAGAHLNLDDKAGNPPSPVTGDIWRNGESVVFQPGVTTGRFGPVSSAAAGGAIRIVDGVRFAQTRDGVAAAVSDLPTTGGKVILPAGTYTGWTGVVLVPDNVEIEGCGASTIIQKAVGSATGFFSNSGANGLGTGAQNTGIAIRHLKIVGEATAATPYAIRMENVTDFDIEDIWCQDILNGDSAAIDIDGCQRFIVRSCRVVNGTNNAIKIRCQAEASTDFVITNNVVDTTAAQNGIFIANGVTFAASRFAITGNVIKDAGDVGIEIGNTNAPQHSGWTVTGNKIYSAAGDGILVRNAIRGAVTGNSVLDGGNSASSAGIGILASAADCTDITISGNVVANRTAGVGIRTGLASTFRPRRLAITNNVVRMGVGGTDGIQFQGYGEDSVIDGNVVVGSAAVGIALVGDSVAVRPIQRCMITNNQVNSATSHGLSASNLTNCVVNGNTFTNGGGFGINLSDAPTGNTIAFNDLRGNVSGTITGAGTTDNVFFNVNTSGALTIGSRSDPAGPGAGDIWRNADDLKFRDSLRTHFLTPLTTKGDLIVHNGTNEIRLPVGTNGFQLTADSTQASGLKWDTAGGGPAGGLTLIDFTKNLGTAHRSGTFDITGLSGLTAGKPVLIVQTAAEIASKGNARDEGEMDQIQATGYVVDATTIRAYWQAPSVVVGTYAFAYAVSG